MFCSTIFTEADPFVRENPKEATAVLHTQTLATNLTNLQPRHSLSLAVPQLSDVTETCRCSAQAAMQQLVPIFTAAPNQAAPAAQDSTAPVPAAASAQQMQGTCQFVR
jgi:hypothetical protein